MNKLILFGINQRAISSEMGYSAASQCRMIEQWTSEDQPRQTIFHEQAPSVPAPPVNLARLSDVLERQSRAFSDGMHVFITSSGQVG